MNKISVKTGGLTASTLLGKAYVIEEIILDDVSFLKKFCQMKLTETGTGKSFNRPSLFHGVACSVFSVQAIFLSNKSPAF